MRSGGGEWPRTFLTCTVVSNHQVSDGKAFMTQQEHDKALFIFVPFTTDECFYTMSSTADL